MISSISIRLACCAVAVLAAGCSGAPQAGNQPPSDAQLQQWAQCMNQHGAHVTVSSNGNGGGSVSSRAPVQGNAAASQQQMQAAQAACKQYRPSSGGANQQPSAQQLDQAAKYVQCVNQHGGDAQVDKNGGIEEQPGPGGPAAQDQADQACQSLAPGGGR
jgi:hypothetical protein